jgi:uncharacterized membrane protein
MTSPLASLRASALAALVTLAAACGSDDSTGIADVTCPPNSTLTYANFGQPFMMSHCLSCHTSAPPRVGSRTEIVAAKDSILEAAVYTKAMPKNKDLALDERRLLGEWLACGAP